VIGIIREAGYSVFDADNPGSDPLEIRYGNIICFPLESGVQADDLRPAVETP
jgi:hypothetical protein